jgi:hypothetical protein
VGVLIPLCGVFDPIVTEVHFVGRFGFGFTCEGSWVGVGCVGFD